MSEIFKAGTQYNDYVGTVAADRSDSLNFEDLLREKSLIEPHEMVVGFEIVFNENSGNSVPDPGIVAYVIPTPSEGMTGVSAMRSVEVFGLPLAEFFAYFKRFNIMLANGSSGLDGQEYELTSSS